MATATTEKPAAKAKPAPETAFAELPEVFAAAANELPKSAREFAEQGLDQTRKAYGRIKDAAEEAADALEASTSRAVDTATALGLKNIDFAKAHVDAAFDLTRKLLKSRDLFEAVELQTDFARARFEAANAHAKAVGEWSTKSAADAAAPFRTQVEKSFEQFRSLLPS
jgi:phasin